jgi:hypothetical protein
MATSSFSMAHCVSIIGEAVARVSEDGRAKAPALPWPRIAGMRHILVHAYYEIDLDAVCPNRGVQTEASKPRRPNREASNYFHFFGHPGRDNGGMRNFFSIHSIHAAEPL